jgi:hypothetical protein
MCKVSVSPIPQFPCIAGWEMFDLGDNSSSRQLISNFMEQFI